MKPSSTEPPPLVTAYLATLEAKTAATVDSYRRVLRQFCAWIVERPGCGDGFAPEQFTRTAVETYLVHLERAGRSISDRTRVRTCSARASVQPPTKTPRRAKSACSVASSKS